MSLSKLRDAFDAMRVALYVPGVLTSGDDFTIELPLDAGFRFEAWLIRNAPPLVYDAQFRAPEVLGADGLPRRSVTFDGVKIQWPVRLEAFCDGTSGPRPSTA